MWLWIFAAVACGAAALAIHDITQRKHAILRNFPIIGHFRYWLEAIGPELRQYIVTSNNEERPFSRDQRRWVYASSKRENNYFGFGTDHDLELSDNYLIVKHAAFPLAEPQPGEEMYDPLYGIPCAKVLGGHRQREKAFRPASVVNISAMSYGALSGPAVEALNRGAGLAKCMHNTGEGGVSAFHQHGGDLVLQVGTGYFGCRDEAGRFSLARLIETVEKHPVRAIEVKLSQGAKPGVGGLLPAAKVTPEIAAARGIPVGRDCASPSTHTAFRNADEMLDFVERIADATGLPVGIKSAVGELEFWRELAELMTSTERGVDFITIDGGEGGTGAAPMVFADHVALPFKMAFSRVYRQFAQAGIEDRIVFQGSGRLGFPEASLFAMTLGCDMIAVAREAMMSIGCIQAQKCHTGHCPAGIATQNKWLMRGLDPTLKAVRAANYVVTLRKELLRLARTCGQPHPALTPLDQLEILGSHFQGRRLQDIFGYQPHWGLPSAADQQAIRALMQQPPGVRNASSAAQRTGDAPQATLSCGV
ncbi:MAG: FMN-binding glutamate synthase family protein [Planctomycetales bacterium]|nr:FMN-binding glutamate synthase family protein [Planctomycetales bacterium]